MSNLTTNKNDKSHYNNVNANDNYFNKDNNILQSLPKIVNSTPDITTNLNIPRSKRIQKLFEVENNSNAKQINQQKIIYNEHIYFNPLKEKTSEEMNKVITNVLGGQANQLDIKNDGKSIYNVNLNINNNYYGSNFNLDNNSSRNSNNNYNDKNRNTSPMKESNITNQNYRDSISSRQSRLSGNGVSPIQSKKKSNLESNQLAVPCLNCNNIIEINEIENHTNICFRVNEEVLMETNIKNLQKANNKLGKLNEYINSKINDNKDAHYYYSLSEYINNAINIEELNEQALLSLKKNLLNLDVI